EGGVMKTVMRDVAELRPHPSNQAVYGKPTENSAYQDIRLDMKRRGFDPLKPLLVTGDGRIIGGVTRWAAAKSLGIGSVPCVVFEPSSEGTAEEEYEMQLPCDNDYRQKTQVIRAREQRLLLETQATLARKRMAQGARTGDVGGEAGTALDKVGKRF